jgi:hypothetical protein
VVRKQKKADVEKAITLHGQAIDQLKTAASKADDAAGKADNAKLVEFLKTTADAYRGYAGARELSRDIARMILDETITTNDDLVKKLTETSGRIKKLEEASDAKLSRAKTLLEEAKKS